MQLPAVKLFLSGESAGLRQRIGHFGVGRRRYHNFVTIHSSPTIAARRLKVTTARSAQ
jgi:hypothetical protein